MTGRLANSYTTISVLEREMDAGQSCITSTREQVICMQEKCFLVNIVHLQLE